MPPAASCSLLYYGFGFWAWALLQKISKFEQWAAVSYEVRLSIYLLTGVPYIDTTISTKVGRRSANKRLISHFISVFSLRSSTAGRWTKSTCYLLPITMSGIAQGRLKEVSVVYVRWRGCVRGSATAMSCSAFLAGVFVNEMH